MGRSKQLLPINERAMIVHAVDAAVHAMTDCVVVVLGANEKEHRAVLPQSTAKVITNQEWTKGMGTSLKLGLNFLVKESGGIEAALVMVCDQPHVTTAHLNDLLLAQSSSGSGIVASAYAGTLGVPAIFHKRLFSEILALGDDEGAKKLIAQHANDIISVAFPGGAVDLDTPEDYRNFAG
jgi:molybdenum cofactor cytidylyltransferase